MEIKKLQLTGIRLVIPNLFRDNRGFFLESYQEKRYKEWGIDLNFVQDNHSYSKGGVVRGMHFQHELGHSGGGQAKLVRVCFGKIYDVVVDLRRDSPTFGKWEGVYLDGREHHQLFIPAGFAHGFCVVSDGAHVLYKTSSPFNGSEERGFRFDDPTVGIQWPISAPILSERDRNSRSFNEVVGGEK